jgi:hypothetical protein
MSVNRIRWWIAPGLVALAMATGACATHAQAAEPRPSRAPVANASPNPIDRTYEAAARAEVVRLLDAFDPPTGAARLAGAPPGVTLDPAGTPGSGAVVTGVRWFRLDGPPGTIRVPAGSTLSLTGSGGGSSSTGYDWPPTSRFEQRQLLVETLPVGSHTIIRVDAQVIYLPARPAGATIPLDRATALTVTLSPRSPSLDVTEPALGPVTTTDPATIARIATMINNAAMAPQGAMRMCPMMTRGAMTLVFRAGAGGAAVAAATIALTGCTSIGLTVGSTEVALDGGPDQVNAVIAAMGLKWPKQ